jgi:hypothetical protein
VTHRPRATAAHVEERKVRDYLLNDRHPGNGGKAAYFRAFGFDAATWTVLRAALVEHAIVNRIAATSRPPHGTKHAVRCSLRTPDGRNPCVTTVWILDGDRPPRLVTCCP